MLKRDANSILSIGDGIQVGKQYTRSFLGKPIIANDHTVLVYNKGHVSQLQWKDIGSGQYILQKRVPLSQHNLVFNAGLARIGFDILYKYDEAKGEAVNIAKLDSVIAPYAATQFGTSKNALVLPSYNMCFEHAVFLSFLFGITVAHGKWTIKNNILYPIKISLPLTSSLFGQSDMFDRVSSMLLEIDILHSFHMSSNGTYDIVQLTLHDGYLLELFASWVNPVVKIEGISTLNNTLKVYEALVVYAKELGQSLPFDTVQALHVLEAD